VTAEDAFGAIAEDLLREPGVEEGTGFGRNPGLRVGGKVFAMLVRGELVVKLPAERIADLASAGSASTFRVGQRQMREWVAIEQGGPHDWPALAREALAFVRG
jgi:hypothetical protein